MKEENTNTWDGNDVNKIGCLWNRNFDRFGTFTGTMKIIKNRTSDMLSLEK